MEGRRPSPRLNYLEGTPQLTSWQDPNIHVAGDTDPRKHGQVSEGQVGPLPPWCPDMGLWPERDGVGVKALKSQPPQASTTSYTCVQHLILSTGFNGGKRRTLGIWCLRGIKKWGGTNDEAKDTKGEYRPLTRFSQESALPLRSSVEKVPSHTPVPMF